MIRVLILCVLAASLSGCGMFAFGKDRAVRSDRVEFDGVRFRSDTDVVSEDRRDFTVTVRNASQSLTGAQGAGEFEANKYCLGVFGGSDIEWTVDPYQDPETLAVGEDDTLTIAGRCIKR